MRADKRVTVHIENVPVHSITDALLAIEAADQQHGFFGEHDRLAALVLGLRRIRDEAVQAE